MRNATCCVVCVCVVECCGSGLVFVLFSFSNCSFGYYFMPLKWKLACSKPNSNLYVTESSSSFIVCYIQFES